MEAAATRGVMLATTYPPTLKSTWNRHKLPLFCGVSGGNCKTAYSFTLNRPRLPRFYEVNGGNCKKASTLHRAVCNVALSTLAMGTGGTKPNISTIGADQFDEFNPKEKGHKLSFFNWWMFSIFFGTLFANTVLVYVQDNVGWTSGYWLPTLGLAISIAILVAGTPFYRHNVPTGNPFTRMSRVVVAAIRKWRVTIPDDIKELNELDLEEYAKKGKFRIDSTPTMSFKIPPASSAGFVAISMLIFVVLYDRFFVRMM